MKNLKIDKYKLAILLLAVCCFPNFTNAQTNGRARIKLDIERQIGEIDSLIYGNFVEHLGHCIYGRLYDPGSPLSDEDGYRKDVIQVRKELNISIVRWLGGYFVSGYHWDDGIVPKDQRPTRIDLVWGFRENNCFGADEYVDWCRKVNTEPYFCVNLSAGTMEEARNWVEYCNVDKGAYYSALRIKYGNKEPFNVKYWGLGNEMDGHWPVGHKDAEDYDKFALETAKLMKWLDHNIKLVAAGSSDYGGEWIHWNRTVLEYLVDHVDYIALHNYVSNHDNDYYKFMGATQFAEEASHITKGIIHEELSKARRKEPIYIASDEYNVWYRARGDEGNEEIYSPEDVLVVASYLNTFVRNADIVKMANLAQLVNVIAPIFTTEDGLFYQTIFYPMQLFANNCYGTAIDAYVDCQTYQVENKDVPYLDVSSAYNKAENEIILKVVTRYKEEAIATDILSQFGQLSG